MELSQLRYFLAVCDSGSALGASARLGVRQSSVSTAIRALERDLNATLFHRVGRGMIPTPAGHALAGPARRIMRECDQSTEVAAGPTRRVAGGLEVAALSTAVSGPFATLVASWLADTPDAVLHVHDLAREDDVVDALSSGSVEIVCTRLPLATSLENAYRVISLGRGDLHVAVPPTSTAPPDRVLNFQDLAAMPMVLVPPGRRSEFERTTARRPLPVAAVVEQREARTAFMLAGIGSTLVGGSLVGEVRERGAHVRRLEPRFRQELGLVFAADQLSPVARSFVDAAVEYVSRRS
ncbi:LysR family transcriptional regulator (plasmid) [Rhodococcus pyridinivorans]|uniref:LysR family transcriptional regulator n=1 Tax=Rhodococcus TaxID=1827 RepID=UPI0007D9D9B8|nr:MULTISPECIES: LysR family transcriptional regulator [Rhodococcus]MCT7293643.1 LysR family transcriptional regulator [Rhodococcus sp. PAE-6]QXU56426.1 LysR family transcriptional regulator [Rhodococcus sp. LW-XY12]UVT27484.1 LysR family transcriptional regulator [Rhodococcus pyridinivorans]WML66460.1 LysR family transcriptional regulator [Rhodococcus sp. AH-ZY2]